MLRNIFLLLLLFISVESIAHNNVVVVPLGSDDAKVPAFRIVPTDDDPPVAGRGRLEYTADPKPSGISLWGKVCDDCFEGSVGCSTGSHKTHSAAHAVCKDLGFDSGLVDVNDTSAATSTDFFALDDVICPDGAQSFSQCTSTTNENCASGEEVFIECFTAPPEIRLSGFTWSCATGLVGSFPAMPNNQWVDIDDTNPLNPVLIAGSTGVGEIRQSFFSDSNQLLLAFNDEVPAETHDYASSSGGNCPANIVVATDSFEFEVTGKGSGLTWLVSGGWFVENNVFNFNDLTFILKIP